ncbi:unnamed protein product [Closterium sp. NIES-64]|nr:unnamed protein product [Closterium sp. NIES-64]
MNTDTDTFDIVPLVHFPSSLPPPLALDVLLHIRLRFALRACIMSQRLSLAAPLANAPNHPSTPSPPPAPPRLPRRGAMRLSASPHWRGKCMVARSQGLAAAAQQQQQQAKRRWVLAWELRSGAAQRSDGAVQRLELTRGQRSEAGGTGYVVEWKGQEEAGGGRKRKAAAAAHLLVPLPLQPKLSGSHTNAHDAHRQRLRNPPPGRRLQPPPLFLSPSVLRLCLSMPVPICSSVADAWRPGAKRGGRCMAARSQAQTSAESRTRRSRQQQQQKNAGAGCMQVDVDVPVSICNDVALVCEDREPAVRMVLRKLFLRRHGRIAVPAGEPWDKDDSGFETAPEEAVGSAQGRMSGQRKAQPAWARGEQGGACGQVRKGHDLQRVGWVQQAGGVGARSRYGGLHGSVGCVSPAASVPAQVGRARKGGKKGDSTAAGGNTHAGGSGGANGGMGVSRSRLFPAPWDRAQVGGLGAAGGRGVAGAGRQGHTGMDGVCVRARLVAADVMPSQKCVRLEII